MTGDEASISGRDIRANAQKQLVQALSYPNTSCDQISHNLSDQIEGARQVLQYLNSINSHHDSWSDQDMKKSLCSTKPHFLATTQLDY